MHAATKGAKRMPESALGKGTDAEKLSTAAILWW
jgi:hypothetical protein